jgi:hypothetical protein
MIHVSSHAISRYRECVAPVSYDEARAALATPVIEAAACFGAHYVRLGGGQRVVIEEGTVVTVLEPRHHHKPCRRMHPGASA